MTQAIKRTLILALWLNGTLAMAQNTKGQTVELLPLPINLSQGQTQSVSLPGPAFVRKLFIQAQATSSTAGYVEVSANGDIKGTLYLPGADPTYVVTLESDTASIELTAVQGLAKISSVKAVIEPGGHPDVFPPEANSQMSHYAMDCIRTVEQLEKSADYHDYGAYLLPVKKNAGVAYAVAEAQGDLSGSARPYYEQLLVSLDHAHPFLLTQMEVEDAAPSAVRLLTTRERIRVLLR